MLRPEMVIQHCKERGASKQSDFLQLIDGIQLGGRIIVGGGPRNSRGLLNVMQHQNRLGVVLSVDEIKEPLNVNHTYTFDLIAITQMIMIAKNEAFHATVDQCINLLQQLCVNDGHSIETGLQTLRETADEVGHL